MLSALKGLLGSKTFWIVPLGAAILSALALTLPVIGLGPETVDMILTSVAGFLGVKGLQQGLADFGKNQKP